MLIGIVPGGLTDGKCVGYILQPSNRRFGVLLEHKIELLNKGCHVKHLF